MQRDDEKRWSIWQLVFPLLLSLCILLLRSRLKSSSLVRPAVDVADVPVVPEGRTTGDSERYEAAGEEDAGEREEEMKPDEGSDVVYAEEVVEVVEIDRLNEEDESEIAENEQASENEEIGEEEDAGSEVEAYCVKCRQKRIMADPQEIETKNGRHALEGTCPVCGTHLFRFVAR
jgi:hypothetical protein